MKNLRVDLLTLGRMGFDSEYARGAWQETIAYLKDTGAELFAADNLVSNQEEAIPVLARFKSANLDAVVLQNGTFSDGAVAVALATAINTPILLWALPEPSFDGGPLRLNSLCGMNVNSQALTTMKREFKYVYGHPATASTQAEAGSYLRAISTIKSLREATIGVVGQRPTGFYGCDYDEVAIAGTFGCRVITISLKEAFALMGSVGVVKAQEEAADFATRLKGFDAAPEDQREGVGRIYAALNNIKDQQHLDAFAVRCWPEFSAERGVVVCSSLARLIDEGIMSACEADVNGAVTMMALHRLTGRSPYLADLVHADLEQNTVLLWHCGITPLSLAPEGELPEASIHYVRKTWATSEGILRAGRVTIARFTWRNGGYRLFLSSGIALPEAPEVKGSRIQVRLDSKLKDFLDVVFYQGLEHHYAIIHADVRSELKEMARLLNIPVLEA